MSTYYSFYAAVKKGDIIEAVGPYKRCGDEYTLVPLLERSRSFIDWGGFDAWKLPVSMMAEKQKDFFSYSMNGDPRDRTSIAYYMEYDEMLKLATDGIVRGYVTVDELDIAAKSNYDPEVLWDICVITPEAVAEMVPEERGKYGHIAYVESNSSRYIARQIIEMTDGMHLYPETDDLYYVIAVE